ncbi:polysaccharide biosynthesis/export family protein [Ramlibacter tataouinensis]|uniref:polysaccharide biosynthesis/export family protein n=1 Tax=Ramlibacter tataouinensis TaxID=94132 RepID=UPI0022F38C33|nr:polysaccharide biosynthesis/export family protein [Ramlibacter tataouinensis]WBY02073.1 polysaccharide biosynthesis/export family protein [Ramlibacter tataouinensis]
MRKAAFAAAGRRAALVLMAALYGCAVVTTPGFDYADPKTRTSVTLGQYVPGDVDNPPQGVVMPITQALVRAQAEAGPKTVSENVQRLFANPKPYTIGERDVIAIIVYDHPELLPAGGTVINQQPDPTGLAAAPGFIVSADGEVTFPYVGRVKVAGLTEIEASELFAKRLAKYIRDPQITVRLQSFRSRRAYVDGEVRTPGPQIFTDVPLTLPEAINRAGGITSAGDRSNILLTRQDQSTVIDLKRLQELGVNPNRILLQPGDMVTVASRDENKVYVMGEVLRPSALPMHSGRLSLAQALGDSGGPNLATANTAQIYVIRKNVQGQPVLFHLNASAPTALALADMFQLQPRDVVYIDPVPLVQWNRIISLILPTAQTVNIGQRIGGQ